MLGSFHVVVEHLHDKGLGAHILRNLGINHLFAAVTLVESLLHDTTADGSHLGTVFGVHDGSHDVTTEGGTNLIEQVVVNLIVLLVFIGTNLQLGAVSSQTRGQR